MLAEENLQSLRKVQSKMKSYPGDSFDYDNLKPDLISTR